jgi:2-oxoisovalerate dehydrogenase E1 component beta subunit
MALTTYIDAISRAMREEMQRDERVFILGEDVGLYGGAFRVTKGFQDEFGEERVIDTPIAEAQIMGTAIGAAMMGMRPIAEMQFMDFISCGFDQLTQYAATSLYRWNQPCPIVVRGPSGGGVHGGPFHSQNNEMWFAQTPGLKVVCPGTAYDAKGLMTTAIRDSDPVIYFEHKYLYRRIKEELPEDDFTVPIGKAIIRKPGSTITLVTYANMQYVALEAQEVLKHDGIDLEIIDLRTISPLDSDLVVESIKKTHKVILLHEDQAFGGIGGELAARISEDAMEYLDGPIRRITPPDTHVPYASAMEEYFLPNAKDVVYVARELAKY